MYSQDPRHFNSAQYIVNQHQSQSLYTGGNAATTEDLANTASLNYSQSIFSMTNNTAHQQQPQQSHHQASTSYQFQQSSQHEPQQQLQENFAPNLSAHQFSIDSQQINVGQQQQPQQQQTQFMSDLKRLKDRKEALLRSKGYSLEDEEAATRTRNQRQQSSTTTTAELRQQLQLAAGGMMQQDPNSQKLIMAPQQNNLFSGHHGGGPGSMSSFESLPPTHLSTNRNLTNQMNSLEKFSGTVQSHDSLSSSPQRLMMTGTTEQTNRGPNSAFKPQACPPPQQPVFHPVQQQLQFDDQMQFGHLQSVQQNRYPVAPTDGQYQLPSQYHSSQINTHGLVTNRTQESLGGYHGDQTEFVLEDINAGDIGYHPQQLQDHQSKKQSHEILHAPKIDERSEEQESMSMSMQEEAISLLREDDSHQSNTYGKGGNREVSTQLLSVTDHLTSKNAVDFWHRYFADMTNNNVQIDAFLDAIQSEFSTNVFMNCLQEVPADSVNEEEVMQDFYIDLQNKVSIDQEVVSLNALELFSRKNGLERAIKTLLEECLSRHKAQRSIKLNDTIVQELSEVKKMLDGKSKQLTTRENDLKRREQTLNREKLEAARELEAMYQKKVQETEKRFTRETQAFQKKLNLVERNLTNKVKLMSQQSSSKASLLASSALKESKVAATDQTKQLKARVSNLEKSYEILKNKHRESEEAKTKLAEENARLLEELAKMKSAKTRLNKEVQELKSLQTSTIETASKKALKVDDLEKSQHINASTAAASAQLSVAKSSNKATTGEDGSSSGPQFLKLVSHILITLNSTFPLMFQQAVAQNQPYEDLDGMESVAVISTTPTPSFGELLYPGFNSIVPQFVEHVLPGIGSLGNKEAAMLIDAFYQILEFAFRTQIFCQAQQAVAQATTKNFGNSIYNLLASKPGAAILLDNTSAAQYKPMHLDFAPKSKHFIAKKVKQVRNRGGSNQVDVLPLYPIFRDQVLQQIVVADLKQLTTPPPLATVPKQKNTAPQPTPLALETRHKVLLCLLKIQLSADFGDLVDSLQDLKQLLAGNSTQDAAQETLLSEESAAMQLLCLTLLLPIPEVSNVTITIFLALSFSGKFGDLFTAQLMQEETFHVFQQAMLAELVGYTQNGQQMTQSAAAGAVSALEDYVVILQKATTRDAASIISLLDQRVIERLHALLDFMVTSSQREHLVDKENSSAIQNSQQQAFLVQNIKSILRNISESSSANLKDHPTTD